MQTIHTTVCTRRCKRYTRRANYTHDSIHTTVQTIHTTCKLNTRRYTHNGANYTHDVQSIHTTCKLYTRRYTRWCKLYTRRYTHNGANYTHDVQSIHTTCKLYTRRYENSKYLEHDVDDACAEGRGKGLGEHSHEPLGHIQNGGDT